MKKKVAALAIGLSIFAVGAILTLSNQFQVIEWKISDLFFKGRPVSNKITIVAIDDKSLSPQGSLGRFQDWPRTHYAQLLRMINQNKPAVIGIDISFRAGSKGIGEFRLKQLLREYERRFATAGGGNPSFNWYEFLKTFEGENHPDDVDFEKALHEGSPVVLNSRLASLGQIEESNEQMPQNVSVIPPIFKAEGNVSYGYVNVMLDRDRIVRRFAPRTGAYKSFSLAIAEAAINKPIQLDWTTDNSQILINYAGKPSAYHTISFVDVLNGNFNPADVEGKIVLVGGTAPALQDIRSTPTSGSPMPGIEINANMIQQLIEGKFLREQSRWSALIIIAILTLAGSFLFVNLRLLYVGILFAAVLIIFPVLAYAMHQSGTVINVLYPEFAWILTAIAALVYRNQTEFREKRQIQKAFSHYVSPVVVNELVKTPDMLKLGGKRETISVMFSDIVGFTSLAEQLSPEDTVALLNDYLTAMTDVIFGFNGTLDKYQGDAIMALYSAPLPDPHHAVNACATALGMRKALVGLHEKWNNIPQLPFKDELIQLDFRVGIATGPAIIGNVGSEKRFDYTAIGDIVNLGSRLESINKKYGTKITVDKETFTAVTQNHNPFVFRKLDTVRVKGKKNETEIFEVVALIETITDETKSMLDDFENGRILYTQRNFKDAKQYFESALTKVPLDGPSTIYANRCDFYLRKPPARDWDAIVDLEEK